MQRNTLELKAAGRSPAEYREADGDAPLRIGIGVHTGEVADALERYIVRHYTPTPRGLTMEAVADLLEGGEMTLRVTVDSDTLMDIFFGMEVMADGAMDGWPAQEVIVDGVQIAGASFGEQIERLKEKCGATAARREPN